MRDDQMTQLVGGLTATVAGDGPTLLFLHGIGSSRAAFGSQVEHFAGGYRCVCPDAPGYGDSPDPDPIADMDGYAEAFEQLLEEVGGGPVGVVGVSFGGVIATCMAIRGVVPMSALVLADTSRGSGVDPASAARMRDLPPTFAEIGAETFAAERTPSLLAPTAPPELLGLVASTMVDSVRLPGYQYAAEAMANTDHTLSLVEVSCPTLVVVGDLDIICPPAESRAIAATVPGAEYAEIPDAGHLANQERSGVFNAVVADFLSRHLPPRPQPESRTSRS